MPTVVVLAEEVQPMLVLQGHDALDSAHALGGPASRQPWAQHRGATTSTHKVNTVTTGRQPDVHHSRSANPPQGGVETHSEWLEAAASQCTRR